MPGSEGGTQRERVEGRGAAWTEERGTSDEGRRCLKGAPRRAGDTVSTTTGAAPAAAAGMADLLYGEAETELRAAVRALLQDRSAWRDVLARTETPETYDAGLWRALPPPRRRAGPLLPEGHGGAGGPPPAAAPGGAGGGGAPGPGAPPPSPGR